MTMGQVTCRVSLAGTLLVVSSQENMDSFLEITTCKRVKVSLCLCTHECLKVQKALLLFRYHYCPSEIHSRIETRVRHSVLTKIMPKWQNHLK